MLGLLEKKNDKVKTTPAYNGPLPKNNFVWSAGDTVTYVPTGTVTFMDYTMRAEQASIMEQQRVYVERTRTLRDRIIKILAGADSAIREHGWVQGSYYRQGKGFCLHGALQYAASGVIPTGLWSCAHASVGSGSDAAAFNATVQVVHTLIREQQNLVRFSDIPSWNDYAGRTVEDVCLLLKQAIERTEKLYS